MTTKSLDATIDALGCLTVVDKRTGKVWSGGRHRLSVRYFDKRESATRTVALNSDRVGQVKLIRTGKGRAVLAFVLQRIGIRFRIQYDLRHDTVVLRIPSASIREDHRRFRLLGITPNPRWGAVAAGEEGYLFLPNRCGAICPFTTRHRATQRALFYGRSSPSQPADAGMPVFGAVHERSAFLGIVTSGQFDAQHVAETHRGPRHLFSTHVSFVYRHHPGDPVDPVDRAVRYVFLAGEEASYVGMAKAYRSYVLNEKKVPSMRKRARQSATLRYYYGAYNDIRLNLGIKQWSHPGQKHDGRGEFRIIQTFRDAMQSVRAAREAGIDRATFILVGCTPDGADGLYPTKLPPDERLGGEPGLAELIRYTRSLGYQIVNWDNYTDAYQNSPDWSPELVQKNRDGSWVTPDWYWPGGLAYKVCPERGLKFARNILPRMKKLGFKGVYLCDSMPVGLFPCFDPNHSHRPGRRSVAEGYRKIATVVRETFGGCHCENSHDYMADCVDAVSHVPVRPTSAKQIPPAQRAFHACFLRHLVPFYPIAYHGIVQYHLLPHWAHRDAFLNAIEFGAVPRNDPGMSADFRGYLAWLTRSLPMMKKEYDVLCNELGHLQFEFIDNHRQAAPGVTETTYADGTRIFVNYRRKDVVCDRVKIPARGYRHLRSGR